MGRDAIERPWEGYVKPFRIFGNLYFVGTIPASTHLIDTGDGLILIDPGYPQSLYQVIENIWELGFDPRNIKIIVITHGHYDHLGAVKALLSITGAKTYISKEDADYANGSVNLTWANEFGIEYYEAFDPDVVLSDGDIISLGNTRILCRNAPGHTPGTMAFFFDVTDGKQIFRAGMHGGVGMNSMTKEYLDKYHISYDVRDRFVPAIDRLMDEQVDIHLGNHVGNNSTVEKSKLITDDYNPFVDPTAWKFFLEQTKEKFAEMLKSEEIVSQ